MLVDRVLADLGLPADEDRGGKREYDAARYRRNREAVIARVACYRAAHKQEIAARDRAYRAARGPRKKHPGELAMTREWKRENAPRVAVYMADYRRRKAADVNHQNAEWRARNPERVKAAKRRDLIRHRPRVYAYNAKRRALKMAVTVGRVDFDAVLRRDSGHCGICGRPVPPTELHYDHIIPLALGGAHAEDNLQVAHRRCNLRKGARCS